MPMKRPEPLVFYQPASIQEATQLIHDHGPGGYFLAGGTDLVIAIKEKGLVPGYVIDLKRIPALSGIHENPDGSLTIGALTTMREVETSSVIRRQYALLAQSAAEVGSIQIRHRATVGGNLANATPSADVAPALLTLDTTVTIAGTQGERLLPLQEFFLGPGRTVMQSGEILTALHIPAHSARLRGEYIKFSPREVMDLAYVGVAVALVWEPQTRQCQQARIALGAVAPTPMRARQAEALLCNQVVTEELAEGVGAEAARACQPISDVRASAAYRREMVRVLTKRAVLNAVTDHVGRVAWVDRRARRY
jgi:CO/xanthine dehydrogenase FAD-binding subunit